MKRPHIQEYKGYNEEKGLLTPGYLGLYIRQGTPYPGIRSLENQPVGDGTGNTQLIKYMYINYMYVY